MAAMSDRHGLSLPPPERGRVGVGSLTWRLTPTRRADALRPPPFKGRRSRARDEAGLLLTHWAEERGTSALHDAADRTGAARRHTLLTFAVVDAEVMLEVSELARGLAVVAQRRAALLDGIVEYRLDR